MKSKCIQDDIKYNYLKLLNIQSKLNHTIYRYYFPSKIQKGIHLNKNLKLKSNLIYKKYIFTIKNMFNNYFNNLYIIFVVNLHRFLKDNQIHNYYHSRNILVNKLYNLLLKNTIHILTHMLHIFQMIHKSLKDNFQYNIH